MTLALRPLIVTDIPHAAVILHDSWQKIFARWIPADTIAKVTMESCVKNWKNIINETSVTSHSIGIFEKDILKGTAIWSMPREDVPYHFELVSMLIAPDAIRQGLGSLMFLEVKAQMKASSAKNFYLNCIDKNE